MGNLITLFKTKNSVYMQRKHENTSAWQHTKAKKIEKFLYFCESKNIKDIHAISKKNYDEFIQNLIAAGKSDETVRKYALAINEFVTRAHIKDIKISANKAKKRKITKKIEKIVAILQKNKIKIDDILKAQIAKIL